MDEQLPQQPIESMSSQSIQQDLPSKPKPTGDSKGLRGTLENLPEEVKLDMEEYMRKVNPHASKKYMIEKYGETYPKLKQLSPMAFRQYFRRHKVAIAKELALQKQSAPPPPEILDVINAITNPDISLEDKRNALTALFNSCQGRSKLLEERNVAFIDPQLEALILANRKEQRIIIEKVATLNEQLSKDQDRDWLEEAATLTQVILSSVYNTYKLTNGDTNFSLFRSSLDENLTNTLKQYKAEKERIKKG